LRSAKFLQGQQAFYSITNFGGTAYKRDADPEELAVYANNYRSDLLRDCPKVTSHTELDPEWLEGFTTACLKYRKIQTKVG
jgi:hypothetical protein